MYIDESALEYGHNACPKCQSQGKDTAGDNLFYYGEGQGYFCFGSCGLVKCSDEYLDETKVVTKGERNLITSKDIDNLKNKALTAEQVAEIEAKTFTDIPKPYRGVPSEVYKGLGVRWEKNGNEVSMYYPITVVEDGNERVVGYKIRKHPKEFYSVGYVGKLGGFLNQSNAVADTLIIVGGEICLASMIHALESDKYRKSYNVVSSSLGEDSTATMIKLNYDWVNAHKKIICALDNDEAGLAAYEKVKAVVDNSKLYRAALRHKDINDYMKVGDFDKIITDVYWNAQAINDWGISGSGDIYEEMLKAAVTESIPLPSFLKGLDNVFPSGIGLGEIWNLGSNTSTGKTVVVNQLTLDWVMNSPHRMLIVTMEDSVGSYGLKIASKVTGINLMMIKDVEERVKILKDNKEEIDKYLYLEDGSHRFNIMRKIPDDVEELKEAVLQSIKLYDSRIILFDPLSSVIHKLSNEEQTSWMLFEEKLKTQYMVTSINVLHSRKTSGGAQSQSEGASMNEEDFKGSGAIIGTGTINMMLSRNRMSEDPIERNTTKIKVSKNRTYGVTMELAAQIYYSPEHHTLFDYNFAEQHGFFIGYTEEQMKNINLEGNSDKVVGGYDEEDIDNIEVLDSF